MDSLLKHMVDMTGHRDHTMLDISVISAVQELACASRARVLTLMNVRGHVYVRSRAVVVAGPVRGAGVVWVVGVVVDEAWWWSQQAQRGWGRGRVETRRDETSEASKQAKGALPSTLSSRLSREGSSGRRRRSSVVAVSSPACTASPGALEPWSPGVTSDQ